MKTPTKEPIVIFVIWFSFFNIPNTSLITIIFPNLPENRGCLPCQAVAYWGYCFSVGLGKLASMNTIPLKVTYTFPFHFLYLRQ